MAKKRESYDVKIVCPGCGAEGRMQGSEGQNPVEGPLNRRIDGVGEGFRLEGGAIICETCGATVPT